MSARAHHTQTSDRQPLSTPKTKIVDSALRVNGNDEIDPRIAGIQRREIVGGVSVPVDAPQSVKDSLLRGGEIAAAKAAAREKRKQPAKNPLSNMEKERRALWRA